MTSFLENMLEDQVRNPPEEASCCLESPCGPGHCSQLRRRGQSAEAAAALIGRTPATPPAPLVPRPHQVKDIKRVADYVAQLRRLGKGHGAWHFDRLLSEGKVDARTY
jgi:hypothetical protein